MASISERKRKDGPSTWQAMVRVSGMPAVIKTFSSEEIANDFARELEKDMREARIKALPKRRPVPVDFGSELVQDIIRGYLKDAFTSKRHASIAATVLNNVGSLRVAEFRRPWVKAYIQKMRTKNSMRGKEFSYSSIVHHMALVRLAIRWRAETLDLDLPAFPPIEALLPDGWKVSRDRRLHKDENVRLLRRLRKLRCGARPHWIALVRLALETGARLQELVLAEWREFDLSMGLWTMPAQHTKAGKRRFVPLSKKARAILKRLATSKSFKDPRVLHLLTNTQSVSTMFHRFTREAKIFDFRFHDLRHEAITRMVLFKRQLSPLEIMRIVGHSSLEMLNRYANLRGEDLVGRMG